MPATAEPINPTANAIFNAMILFQRYKNVYPNVIINYDNNQYYNSDKNRHDILNSLQEFGSIQTLAEDEFKQLFYNLKAYDNTLDKEQRTETVLSKGILSVEPSYFKAKSLVLGEYPFRNLRVIALRESDIAPRTTILRICCSEQYIKGRKIYYLPFSTTNFSV